MNIGVLAWVIISIRIVEINVNSIKNTVCMLPKLAHDVSFLKRIFLVSARCAGGFIFEVLGVAGGVECVN